MQRISAFAETAALMGDPARANMLFALMDGRALTAGELARFAGVTPQTASGHLAKLAEAGMIAASAQGRHRYFRVATPAVAQMVESVMSVAEELASRPLPFTGPRDTSLRRARTCYDHLAGELAVAIAGRMAERGQLVLGHDGAALTGSGVALLGEIGVAADALGAPCRACLDWSERRPHLAGTPATALYRHFVDQAWVRPRTGTRALEVTRAGEAALARWFGL
ncbi:winged helix-turn-helix domain-containing protein [Sphingomonas sp. KR3-1]|uniref:ArsR/SmtB family transcription factor n=1 Tax=Sphingomonas sp. KR3-1 TaxID=3156611 RepID=UPI0032B60E29